MPGRAAVRRPGWSQQRTRAAASCCWTSLAHPVSQGGKGTGLGGAGWAPGPHHSFGLNPSTSYDEDFNHEPCQKKGYKAHWAVSTGRSSLLYSHVFALDLPSPPLLLLTVSPLHWHLPSTLKAGTRTGPSLFPQGTYRGPGKLQVTVSANRGFHKHA